MIGFNMTVKKEGVTVAEVEGMPLGGTVQMGFGLLQAMHDGHTGPFEYELTSSNPETAEAIGSYTGLNSDEEIFQSAMELLAENASRFPEMVIRLTSPAEREAAHAARSDANPLIGGLTDFPFPVAPGSLN